MALELVRKRPVRSSLAVCVLAVLPAIVSAQGTRTDYGRALGLRERYESLRITTLTFPDDETSIEVAFDGNTTFDLLYIPGAGHGARGTYGERKRFDFLVQHLIEKTSPAWDETPLTTTSSGSR